MATASKVVNGKADVASQTRARVEAAMEELNYFKSSTKNTSSQLIEMAFQHLDNNWIVDILQGASEPTQNRQVRLALSQLDNMDELTNEWVEEVVVRRPLGAIAVFSKPSPTLAKRLASRNIPCVFIDPWGNPTSGIMSVQADNWSGGLFATRHLLELGHRRIATITGPNSAMCANARLDGYRNALSEAGVQFDSNLVRRGGFLQEDGRKYTLELLKLPNRPTAIFAQSDFIAMGVYEAAQELGLSIPADLSVVGFDDSQTAKFMGPRLTTIHQPTKQMAQTAAQMILDVHAGKQPNERVILPTSLIMRDSTAQI